jgi:hypothetical protein
MPIVGGLDIHRKQITFDYLDTATGQVVRGQVCPADREHLRAWLARFVGRDDAAFAVEGCTGWRYVAEELAAAGVAAHLTDPADTAFARGRKRHAKTDCRHLRTLLAEGRLPECWIPPARILECRALLETCGRPRPPSCPRPGSYRSPRPGDDRRPGGPAARAAAPAAGRPGTWPAPRSWPRGCTGSGRSSRWR